MTTKGHCDYHTEPPVEAEVRNVTMKATYKVLRCPVCDRVRGVRRIVH